MSSLQALIQPWSGYAVRHIPDTPNRAYDIYDFSYAGRSTENRWNVAGEPTLYLAKEKNVALAEYARHFEVNRTLGLTAKTYRRKVYRFKVELDAVLDLRELSVGSALSLQNAPDCSSGHFSPFCGFFRRFRAVVFGAISRKASR